MYCITLQITKIELWYLVSLDFESLGESGISSHYDLLNYKSNYQKIICCLKTKLILISKKKKKGDLLICKA